jgi:acetyl-CoA carboxylase biotin carboxylase subunit
MTFDKLLIANRGEIAVRIIRAARELGIRTVQAHSEADRDSLAVHLADEAVEIGPPPAAKSYLNTEAILSAARETSAGAIHPGYGFLAENAGFAEAVEKAGFVFVGPSAATIRMMGDKVAARQAAMEAGVPTVPGSKGRIASADQAHAIVETTGFPVMIKAAAGGGGRGIRIAHDMHEFNRLVHQAEVEAQAAFGDGGLYIERAVEKARHIEVQVLGDGERVVHCFERECSLQRRRQKLWEEAPAIELDVQMRTRLCEAAVALAEAVHYRGAGTVEFLFDEAKQEFFFLEMNTRIQVEHPVTECITGLDLVGEMLRIAGGERLRFTQDDIGFHGHAIEVRLNAEDPANGFAPGPGQLTGLRIPGGPGVRFDTMLFPGYTVPPFYDSLLGKLIVWGEDRPHAIRRLKAALAELEIAGVKTTAPLFEVLADEEDVRRAKVHTRWLEHWLETNHAKLS